MSETINPEERAKKIRKGVFKYFSLKVLVISSLFICSILVFALIIHEAVYENEPAFDNKVFSYFAVISSDGLISVMKFFTFFGSSNFLLPAYIVLLAGLVILKKYRYSLHVAIIALSSTGLMFALKDITHRHRPALPVIKGLTNYSFPSGHTLSTFIFCGIFTYIIWHAAIAPFFKWLYIVLLFCFTITVGISRIILKVHYPTDVIASFCIGIVWAISSLWILRKISKKDKLKETEEIHVPDGAK